MHNRFMNKMIKSALCALVVLFGACGDDVTADVDRVSTAQLKAALAAGTAVAVDVRFADEYKAQHIKGAINIPYGDILKRLKELPLNKQIVAYCA